MKIRRALISVSEKNGLSTFAQGLHELGAELISTSGTAAFLEGAGVPVTTVEQLTGSAELLGGRVKTLHGSLHAAILARRDHEDDMASLAAAGIQPIDLVVCNLYPFRSVAARRGVAEAEVIANIDIGGPTMVRAAAKNFDSVAVVTDPERYGFLLDELRTSGGELSPETRLRYRSLVRAFIVGDRHQVVELCGELGVETRSGRPDTLLAFVEALLGNFQRAVASGTLTWPSREQLLQDAGGL